MQNIEKSYIGRNIYILPDTQGAMKALDSFWIISNYSQTHQSLLKLAEHNRIQLIRVPWHWGIEGNEVAGESA
jgi:hypothetical protein